MLESGSPPGHTATQLCSAPHFARRGGKPKKYLYARLLYRPWRESLYFLPPTACSSFGITLYANTFSSTLLNPSDFGAKTCIWKIRSQVAGYAVQISFNHLVVGSSSSCSSNYIAIHDGSSSSSVQLGKVCGSAKPPIIRSRGSYLYLKLVKTWSASFSITYKAVRLGKLTFFGS